MTSAASVERIHYWAEPLLVEVRVKEISTHPPASLTVEGNNQTPSIVELPATKDNYRSASGRSGCETVACFQLLPASTRSRAPGHQRSYLATTWQNSHHCHFKFSTKKYLRHHNNVQSWPSSKQTTWKTRLAEFHTRYPGLPSEKDGRAVRSIEEKSVLILRLQRV